MAKKEGTPLLDIGAFVLALLALIVSIVAPIVSYRYLQNDIRVQQLKASAVRVVSNEATNSTQGEGTKATVTRTKVLEIRHEGELPVGGVELIFERFENAPKLFEEIKFTVSPPVKYTKEIDGETLRLSLDQALAPKAKIQVTIRRTVARPKNGNINGGMISLSAWIRTEATPAVPIDFDSGNSGGYTDPDF